MRKETKYEIAIQKNISESEIQWSRFSVLLAVNTAFLAIISEVLKPIPSLLRFSLPLVGILICILWFLITKRGFMWIHFWIKTAREIEDDFGGPIWIGYEYQMRHKSLISTETASYMIIIFFGIIYYLYFIYYFF